MPPVAARDSGSFAASCANGAQGDFVVAEVDFLVAGDLIIFVALAGEEDDIALAGLADGGEDGLFAIRFNEQRRVETARANS